MDALSKAASDSLGRPIQLDPASGGGYSGGGGAQTSAVKDKEGNRYFVKSASGERDMLRAEYLGIKEMFDTHTIRVPQPIAWGEHKNRAFVIFEYLEF